MNVTKPDYAGLVREIAIARGKDFTPQQVGSLVDELKSIEWKDAFKLTVLITRMPNLPSNMYGLVLNRIDEIKDERNKELEQRETWKPATEDCASPEEFSWTMKVIAILCRFKDAKNLCIKNGERMTEAIEKNQLLDYLKRAYAYYSKQISEHQELLKPEMPFRV